MADQWDGCYEKNWKGLIVPEAFKHPAKFSRSLIKRIYEHAKEMGWIKEGDWVLDPFGGVALGALDAIRIGLIWVGVELEEKFVKLGEQNIEFWKTMGIGTARIIQGDSRYLENELFLMKEGEFDLVVS